VLNPMNISAPWPRRRLLKAGLAFGAGAFLPRLEFARGAEAPARGGQLVVAIFPEPPYLTSALSTLGPAQVVSGKIFDGLLTYAPDLTPRPQLAESWQVGADGLSVRFALRPGVTWHDGTPFTSADVAYSLLTIWKQLHSRGRSTFANVEAVESPDPLTSIWRLSKPAPYLLSALAAVESQIVPKHLYDGTDPLTNPHNLAPVGTGPFRFAGWERGNYIVLERNPTYWDQPKPYLDRIVFRVLPDAAERANALETGEVQLLMSSGVQLSDLARFGAAKELAVERGGYAYTAGITSFEFNLDRPVFQDVRVRHAFAHAIDRDFILKNVFYGYGAIATGPIPPSLTQFYTADVPLYRFDLAKAAALLDEAGLKPDAQGTRLTVNFDPAPIGDSLQRAAEAIRDTLGRVGVKLQLRTQDFAGFVRRIYTDRAFDTILYSANAAPDPAISSQRFYWSKNFQPGVAFSNGSHYASAEADHLLETAQAESDPKERRALYVRFQQLVQTDLPTIPLIAPEGVSVADRRARDYSVTADGAYGNFAEAYLVPK